MSLPPRRRVDPTASRATRRNMARPLRRRRRAAMYAPLLVVIGVAFVAIAGAYALLGGPSADSSPGASARAAAVRSIAPRVTVAPTEPSTVGPSPTASRSTASPTSAASPAATPWPTPIPHGAPRSPVDFELLDQAIDIQFPIPPTTRYRYRDNFLEWRPGPPRPYNHARTGQAGKEFRVHDGIDIYAAEGEPVLAPFSGVVIDPATRWQPWVPDRYGLTVVVVSDEPQTAGYAAFLVHLDSVRVQIGDRVERGDIVGLLGETGSAVMVRPHLHFELRAPFLLDWSDIGEERLVDAFNPYRSLVEADPKR